MGVLACMYMWCACMLCVFDVCICHFRTCVLCLCVFVCVSVCQRWHFIAYSFHSPPHPLSARPLISNTVPHSNTATLHACGRCFLPSVTAHTLCCCMPGGGPATAVSVIETTYIYIYSCVGERRNGKGRLHLSSLETWEKCGKW